MAIVISLLITLILLRSLIETKQYAAFSRRRCIPDITVAWSRELSSGPFAGVPLISDIDADGELDIAVASFSGEVDVLKAKDGEHIAGTFWPFRLSHGSFYASPLQYDVNHDGILDIITCSGLGQLIFLNYLGEVIKDFQLPKVGVSSDWFHHQTSIDISNIRNYLDTSLDEQTDAYVYIDPHVLATPVIEDVNRDGVAEELVIPVSYYLDLDDYSHVPDKYTVPENVNVNNYVLCGLAYFNLTSMTLFQTVFLDLTKMSSDHRAYLLSSPTIADIDPNLPGAETLVGSSAGHLHLIGAAGNSIEPFPLRSGVIQSQVVVEDVDDNGSLEVIFAEVGGNIICYELPAGRKLWERQLTGGVPIGIRLIDIDLHIDVLVATDAGQLWVLDGVNGEIRNGWPVKVDGRLSSVPLVTRLYDLDKILFVNLDRNADLNVISVDRACQYKTAIHETSLVSLLSHDLIPGVPGLELLIAAADGALLCLTANSSSDATLATDYNEIKSACWPAEHKTHNQFTFSDFLILTIDIASLTEVNSYSFNLPFTVIDLHNVSPYTCQISAGSIVLHSMVIFEPGTHSVVVASPETPLNGHLVMECRTRHGKLLRDTIVISFNKTFLSDLQWLLIGPTFALLLFLLFFHGFPAADILPVTLRSKRQ